MKGISAAHFINKVPENFQILGNFRLLGLEVMDNITGVDGIPNMLRINGRHPSGAKENFQL